jgi:SAM-dependent methyltransferase
VPGVREHYASDERLAARQQLWHTSRREPPFDLYSWVLGVARLDGSERVLDLGCGNGAYLERISAIGLDASVGMLHSASARTTNPLVAGDAAMLPFRSSSFDLVLAAHMLYHVEDRAAALAEIARVLTPSGSFVAVTNSGRNQHEMVALVEEVVGGGWKWRRPADVAFSLENGEEQLRSSFDNVTRVICPPGAVLVTDAHALGQYLESVGDVYQHEIDRDWGDIVQECVRRVSATIAREGQFEMTAVAGAFVCRDGDACRADSATTGPARADHPAHRGPARRS